MRLLAVVKRTKYTQKGKGAFEGSSSKTPLPLTAILYTQKRFVNPPFAIVSRVFCTQVYMALYSGLSLDKLMPVDIILFNEQWRSYGESYAFPPVDAIFVYCERTGDVVRLEGQVRIPSGCAVAAVISRAGKVMSGEKIITAMKPMHDRSNGLGGGYAGYGIYPEYRDFYAFHLFFNDNTARKQCEQLLKEGYEVVQAELIPTRQVAAITDAPLIWRYIVQPLRSCLERVQLDEKEYVTRTVMKINTEHDGANVFSSGKNMGAFKAVGFPEDVGAFYRLDEYAGYCWTAHGRYPTNTPGWWGGAHPFTLLDYSIVHNGEISSYDANRRFIEMYGYKCTLQTDTEVMTYIMDYLLRIQSLTLEEAAAVIAAPFWSTIDMMNDQEREKLTYLRAVFAGLLVTGPFSIVLGFSGGLMALNDRLKLRSMVVGEKDDKVFIASEEAAIRAMEPDAENIFAPAGGEPVIVRLEEGSY
jgi:glutamate synthase domain-containing protein 1